MDSLMHFVRGPLFTAALVFLILGLFRVFFLQLIEIGRAWGATRREGSREEFRQFLLFVWRSSPRTKLRSSLIAASLLFYFLTAFIALFLQDHVRIIRFATGIDWGGVSKVFMTYIALVAAALGAALILIYLVDARSRGVIRPSDYLLKGLIVAVILTGLMAAHPSFLIMPYSYNMVVHMLAAVFIFVAVPFSHLARILLFPASRIGSGLLLNPKAGQGTGPAAPPAAG